VTASETTGSRDLALSQRHRLWGFDCPAADIDFLMVEYNRGVPVALIDYKHHNSKERYDGSANMRAVVVLADRAAVPFFVARYCPRTWWFRVHPKNDLARKMFEEGQPFREIEFVEMLYRLRGIPMPATVRDMLCHSIVKSYRSTSPPSPDGPGESQAPRRSLDH
jgi:hypothetical protein